MFGKNKKNLVRILVFLTIFLMFSVIATANTQGGSGGTGIFDVLLDFLKKLIIDFRYLLISAGVIGIIISVIGEIWMPDMARSVKMFVSSCVAFAIGISGEVIVNQLGGTMINLEIISQNTQYLKLVIGV